MRTYNLKIGGQSFEARIVEYSESKVIVNLNGDLYEVEIEPEQGPRSPVLIRSAPERKSARAISQRTESPQPAETPQQVESPLQVSRLSAGLVIAPIPGVRAAALFNPPTGGLIPGLRHLISSIQVSGTDLTDLRNRVR